MRRVGWIGVGALATPILRRLTGAGLRPTLFDPRPAATAPFAETADLAPDVASVAAASDLLFCALPDDAALEAVAAAALPALPRGAVFCDLSTVSPEASARVAALAGTRSYLRAPVSGSVAMAEQGTLTVLASGPPDALAACEPVLALFSARRMHVGAAEEARVLKLAINAMVGATAALMAESLTLARKAGLDPAVTLEAVGASAVASPLVRYKIDALARRDFAPAFTTALMVKDMTLFLDAAARFGAPATMAGATLAMLRRHADAGGAGEDFFAVVKTVEKAAGLDA